MKLLISLLLLMGIAFAGNPHRGYEQHRDRPTPGHREHYYPESGRDYHRVYRDRRIDHPEWIIQGGQYRYYYYEPYYVVPPPNCVWFPRGIVVCF